MIKRTLTVIGLAGASIALATGTASAAPAPAPAPAADSSGLADLLGPALALIQPLTDGAAQGASAGSGNLNAAARDAGQAVNQAAQGVGDAAQGVAQGAGETVAEVPGAADRTIHNLEHGGITGKAVNTLFGAPHGN